MNYENPFDKALSGEEIKNWIWHHSHRKSKYTHLAKGMNKFFNLDDTKIFMLKMCDGAPIAIEVEKRGVKYDIPCDN